MSPPSAARPADRWRSPGAGHSLVVLTGRADELDVAFLEGAATGSQLDDEGAAGAAPRGDQGDERRRGLDGVQPVAAAALLDEGRSTVALAQPLLEGSNVRLGERGVEPEAENGKRGLAKLERSAQGDHPAPIDDRDPVGDPLDVGQVVAREEDRDALVAQLSEERPGRCPALDVHPGRRLVEDDEARPTDEGEGQPEPLLLAARQPAIASPRRGRQPDQLEQLIRVSGRDVESAVEAKDLAGGHPRIDAATALEHQPDPRPMIAPSGRRVLAENADLASVRPSIALDHLDGRRLAGTVGPEQPERLAGRDPERDPPQDSSPVVALDGLVDLDRGKGAVRDGRHDAPEIRPNWRSKSSSRTSPIWIERRIPARSMK